MSRKKKEVPDFNSAIDDIVSTYNPELTEEEQTIIQNGKEETVIQTKMNVDDEKPKNQKQKKKKEVPEDANPRKITIDFNTEKEETKGKRVQLLMKPSFHAELVQEAKRVGLSLNEMIYQILSAYMKGR